MDPLFPELPEDLKGLSDAEVGKLLEDHESAKELVLADDEEFLAGLSADDIIAQLETGVAQIKTLRAEVTEREQAHENFVSKRSEIVSELEATEEEEVSEEAAPVEVVAEASEEEEGGDEEEVVEEPEKELVVAAATPTVRYARTPPAPSPQRVVVQEPAPQGAALVASGSYRSAYEGPLTPDSLAQLQKDAITEYGPMPKMDKPGRYITEGPHGNVIWDGPRVKTARADFPYVEERKLTGDPERDIEKIREALPEYVQFMGQPGGHGGEALVASGGLCAPLTPIYSMPNFGSEAEPVWDALPTFMAARGGVNVPDATYIADITTAISSISEEEDALGGTFATKSCQALDCPDYTEVAVQILAHCREYGNLNARAWPEKIAHENALTMQALSRTSEGFMLDRIKALSVNVTSGADTLGAVIYLVNALKLSAYGIRSRLRMSNDARFRALLPSVILDMLELDVVTTPFDRWRNAEQMVAYLRSIKIDPVFYMDTPSTGESQIADASQAAGAVDGFPDEIQAAIYPEGTFLGIDGGTLELGIVRDSTLNSTNDFQVFGERFRNVALLGPAQAAHWHTINLCPVGEFPPAGTARTCESA